MAATNQRGSVVYSADTAGVQLVGTIAACVGNTATGDSLPGLSIAGDVCHFQDTIANTESLDQARNQKQIQADEQKAQEVAARLPEAVIPDAPASSTREAH